MAKNEPKIYKKINIWPFVIKVVISFIVIIIILLLTAFFGFRKYIAYTDTGKLYLDIPWLYGYMDGPPTEDDLAYLNEPVYTEPEPEEPEITDENAPEGENGEDTGENTGENGEASPEDSQGSSDDTGE